MRGSHFLERPRTTEPDIVSVGDKQLGEAFFTGAGDPDGDEPGRIPVPQRAQKNGMDDAPGEGAEGEAEIQAQAGKSGVHFSSPGFRAVWRRTQRLQPTTPHSGLGGIREHGEQFQQVAVGVVEVQRGSRHPGENDGFIGGRSVEIERIDSGGAKAPGRIQQVLKVGGKGDVKTQTLGTGSNFPQTEHGIATAADPIERDLPFRKDRGELQPQDPAVEGHGAFEVRNREMRFEEIANGNHAGLYE